MKIDRVVSPVSFTHRSVLKYEWRANPEMREHVRFGLYGGELTEDTLSFEHIKPASKGGSTALSNGALATKELNRARGNSPLADFLTKEMFFAYADQFKGWCAKLFNNEEYIKNITKTVENQGVKLK